MQGNNELVTTTVNDARASMALDILLQVSAEKHPTDKIGKWWVQFYYNGGAKNYREPLHHSRSTELSHLVAIPIALGSPYIIFDDCYNGKLWIPEDISPFALFPLDVRLRTLEYLLKNLTESETNSPKERFLHQIYSACAELSTDLTIEQGVDDNILPLIQLLPALRCLKLGSYSQLQPSRLQALRPIPLEARISLLQEISAHHLADMGSYGKENFRKILQACERNVSRLSISIDGFGKLAVLTWLLPELKSLKIDGQSIFFDNLQGMHSFGPLEKLTIDASGFKRFENLYFLGGSVLRELTINNSAGTSNFSALHHGHHLSSLTALNLFSVPNLTRLETDGGPMRSLRELSIYGASRLTTLGEMKDFPFLEKLTIRSVEALDSLQGLENLPALRKIVISRQERERLLPKLIELSLPAGLEVFDDSSCLGGTKIGYFAPSKALSGINSKLNATIFVATSTIENSYAGLVNSLVSMPETSGTFAHPMEQCIASIKVFPDPPLN